MCIGLPMQVVSSDAHGAVCQLESKKERIDMSLVGKQPAGTWVLVFLGAAREVMDAKNAYKVLNAVKALQTVAQGSDHIDHLFADLIGSEPYLPEHLREAASASAKPVNKKGLDHDISTD